MKNHPALLLVEDDPLTRMAMAAILKKSFNVIVRSDGAEALTFLRSEGSTTDLVLTDITMPEMDGLGLLAELKKMDLDLCIIMVSGSEDIDTAVKAMRLGAFDYVKKPLESAAEIEVILWRWLEHQSLESKLQRYSKLQKEMQENIKSRTFLSIDVVGSTALKQDQDLFLAHYSFKSYVDFISRIVESWRGIVHSTAGDGVMNCFECADDAAAAAIQILEELDFFNRTTNRLPGEFKLRLGLHSGSVIIGKQQVINEMFSQTLDITAKLQAQASPNSILISEAAYESLSKMKDRFVPAAVDSAGEKLYSFQSEATESDVREIP